MESKECVVLIAEDNEFNASFFCVALQSLGIASEVASNGQEALKLMKAKEYDLIFMDCMMPVMDGYEATREIRAMGREYAEIPIIALTATLSEESRQECLHSGMNDVLQKPVELNDLKQLIDKYITNKSSKAITEGPSFQTAVEVLCREMRFSYQDAGRLLSEFNRITAQIVMDIESAYMEDRCEEVRKYAHQLKGMACNMRLRELQQLAAEIEKKDRITKEELQNLHHIVEKLRF